jgi:hypothetical protein
VTDRKGELSHNLCGGASKASAGLGRALAFDEIPLGEANERDFSASLRD